MTNIVLQTLKSQLTKKQTELDYLDKYLNTNFMDEWFVLEGEAREAILEYQKTDNKERLDKAVTIEKADRANWLLEQAQKQNNNSNKDWDKKLNLSQEIMSLRNEIFYLEKRAR